jgi:hypothetical protein
MPPHVRKGRVIFKNIKTRYIYTKNKMNGNSGRIHWKVTPNLENSEMSPEEKQELMDALQSEGLIQHLFQEVQESEDQKERQEAEDRLTQDTYEFSVEGIKSLPPDKLNELVGMVTYEKSTLKNLPESVSDEDREEVKERMKESEAYKKLITIKFRSGGFDVERNWEIIETILEEYSKVMEWTLQHRSEDIRSRLRTPDEHSAFDQVINSGIPLEIYRRAFFEVMIGDWKNRQLYVKWFHKKMAEDDMTAPVEVFNTEFGRGLRATRDIKKGDLVVYYPMDWVSDSSLAPCDENTGEKLSDEQCKWICLQNAGIIGYGNPYSPGPAGVIMDKLRDNLGRITRDLNDYGFSFGTDGGAVHIWGDPDAENHKTNNWFLGHMINDGGYHPEQTKEGYRELNSNLQNEAQNIPTPSQDCNVLLDTRIRAMRDIKKGEEIKTFYGQEYWFAGGVDVNGKMDKKDLENDACHCRHTFINLTKNQKKKEKKRIKEGLAKQNRTFRNFREQTALGTSEKHGIPVLPSQVCLVNATEENGSIYLASVIVHNDTWIDGHPTQFSKFYPEFRTS